MRKFAISDIHGCNRTFNALLKQIQFSKSDELYLLGDYIDRGPDSKGVIDTIFGLQKTGHFVKCLRGNHEEGILKSRSDRNQLYNWHTYWGGEQTLRSFGSMGLIDIPRIYWNFFEDLDYYAIVDEFILVHAGLNFVMENPLDDKHSMLWIRDWYIDVNYEWLKNRVIVHGHTPIDQSNIVTALKQLNDVQILNIDNGCFRTNSHGMKHLCAFEMTERKLFFQDNLDDMGAYFA